MKSIPGIAAPKQNLRRLLTVRWLLVLCLLFGTGFARWGFDLELPYGAISSILVLIVLFNWATWWRLRQPWAVTPVEFFLQILLDILGVTLLFYYSGGGSNPFVFYYLVPLSISSATLPWRFTWALTLLSVICYTLLLFYHVPIREISPVAGVHVHGQEAPLNAHILGMWFNFLVSAGLITYFVVRMSNALKQQQNQLNEYREESLRDEQVLAVATLAAGTAHELASPLTTMKLLLKEMAHEHRGHEALESDLDVLIRQVDLCSHTLKDLVRRAEFNQKEPIETRSIGEYCDRIIERWLLLRPEVKARVSIQTEQRDVIVSYHSTVEQAIINLLSNAADAARDQVMVSMAWDADFFRVTIEDDGEGIPERIKEQLGQPFVTTKGRGLGLGIFLSNATISRYGGTMTMVDRGAGGTLLTINLPFKH
jgi:two-component system sensor histidine kinase RegB